MVSVVNPDKIDIFSEMETSAILSISEPMDWSFSFSLDKSFHLWVDDVEFL